MEVKDDCMQFSIAAYKNEQSVWNVLCFWFQKYSIYSQMFVTFNFYINIDYSSYSKKIKVIKNQI
jgi:hypothetical protein